MTTGIELFIDSEIDSSFYWWASELGFPGFMHIRSHLIIIVTTSLQCTPLMSTYNMVVCDEYSWICHRVTEAGIKGGSSVPRKPVSTTITNQPTCYKQNEWSDIWWVKSALPCDHLKVRSYTLCREMYTRHLDRLNMLWTGRNINGQVVISGRQVKKCRGKKGIKNV